MDADSQKALGSLAARYHQRLPPPRLAHALPAPAVLIRPAVQAFLYDHMFDPDSDHAWPLAPAAYRLRVLKMLLEVLEGAAGGDDEIIDPLMDSWSQLLVSQPKAVSDVEQVQKLGFVKYTAPAPAVTTASETDKDEEDRTVITSESPSLILSSGSTGFRTWEAALHLATYLATDRDAAQRFVRGKRVVELGAGTGLVALFLARFLEPSRVMATDRDEGLVARLGESAARMNGIRGGVLSSRVLVWGEEEEEVPGACFGDGAGDGDGDGDECVDTAVGADLIYDTDLIPPLVSTLVLLFDKYDLKQFLISATLRNPHTFEAFLLACRQNHLAATPVPFESPPEDQQTGFFHSTAIPIRTFVISRGEHDTSSWAGLPA